MPSHRRTSVVLSTVVVGSLLFALGIGAPAHAVDYPSWDEVEQARSDAAAAKRAVDEIETHLVALETKAMQLARTAQLKAEESNAARGELDAATARSLTLQEQADEASERAATSSKRAGALIAQVARTGGGSVSLALLMSQDPDDLLNSLGTMGKLTEQSASIYSDAITDANAVASLTGQAELAEEKRAGLATAAETAATDAQAASTAVITQVQQQQAAATQLYDQLASLKGTTADVERRYLEGLVSPPAPTPGTPNPTPGAPAPSPGNPPPGNPGTPTNPNPPPTTPGNPAPPVVTPPVTPPPVTPPVGPPTSAAQRAIDYAMAQIGKPYVNAGSGPHGFDCSGLTLRAYEAAGVYIGIHGSTSQYRYQRDAGNLVPISQMMPGDLLFYSDGGSTEGTKYHVTIYLGGGQMIEAPYEPLSVRVTSVRSYDLVPFAARPAR